MILSKDNRLSDLSNICKLKFLRAAITSFVKLHLLKPDSICNVLSRLTLCCVFLWHFFRHCQMDHREWKYTNFDQNSIEVCCQASNFWYSRIRSDNGLAPTLWTDDGYLLMHICVIRPEWVNTFLPYTFRVPSLLHFIKIYNSRKEYR